MRSGATSITDGFTDDPLHIVRSTPADANNMIKVESLDRQNNYNTAGTDTFEQGSIEVYGVRRDKSTKARLITDPLYEAARSPSCCCSANSSTATPIPSSSAGNTSYWSRWT